jgi:hypothetical protein
MPVPQSAFHFEWYASGVDFVVLAFLAQAALLSPCRRRHPSARVTG